MIREGQWKVKSKTNPEWNNDGHCLADIQYGSLRIHQMEAWLNTCKKKFGTIPKDLIKQFWEKA